MHRCTSLFWNNHSERTGAISSVHLACTAVVKIGPSPSVVGPRSPPASPRSTRCKVMTGHIDCGPHLAEGQGIGRNATGGWHGGDVSGSLPGILAGPAHERDGDRAREAERTGCLVAPVGPPLCLEDRQRADQPTRPPPPPSSFISFHPTAQSHRTTSPAGSFSSFSQHKQTRFKCC